jgi:isoaspartyl peptidase/L-asparaginase-like protein (Ntn-hydrolase superfamily)
LCCFSGKLLLQLQQEERVLKFGRISDSATVAGNYANEFCGVSLTGEDIVSNATATKIVSNRRIHFTRSFMKKL